MGSDDHPEDGARETESTGTVQQSVAGLDPWFAYSESQNRGIMSMHTHTYTAVITILLQLNALI